MKCAICDKEFGDGIAKIVDGLAVHEECYMKKQEEAVMAEQNVQATPVEENGQPQPKCEIIIGMEPNGNLYFIARGEDPSLLNIQGLVKFAEKKLDQIWDSRMNPPKEVNSDAEVQG